MTREPLLILRARIERLERELEDVRRDPYCTPMERREYAHVLTLTREVLHGRELEELLALTVGASSACPA